MNHVPLPEKLRPKNLENYIGQENIIGTIKKLIENKSYFPSLIFWGPPGSGKTTLARIIANKLGREFHEFSAVSTKIKQIEEVLKDNKHQPVVFIDEIHRFNKAQQDKLLPYVEKGNIILIGATTENPSFEVIPPLLSRCRVIILKQHDALDLEKILTRGLKLLKIKLDSKAKEFLVQSSNGDARVLLNVLEIATSLSQSDKLSLSKNKTLNIENIEEALQRKQLNFDKQGEEFYNVISAFIKSMRASDVDAALYYLARMIAAGQDALYIARRMVVFASEDIGMAQPTALVVANDVFRACETVGYPECQENLAHGVVYLALAKKDRRAYDAYMSALKDVQNFGNLPVPMSIRNAPTKLMKDLGYGKGYQKYTKDSLLPEKLKNKKYYMVK